MFGCGYVGGELARQALARGMRVTALTRNAARAAALAAEGAAAVVAELSSDAWHARIPGDVDCAVNCVGAGGGGLAGYRRSYRDGMRSLLAWAARARPGSLVYTSSTSVYPQGTTPGGAPPVLDEAAPTDPPGRATSAVLRETEELLRAAAAPPPAGRWFILRLAGIYGPGRHRLLDQVRGGEVDGAPDHLLNLVHRDDVCGALWAVLTAPPDLPDGIFNVADDAPSTRREIALWLAARLALPVPRFAGGPAEGRRAPAPERVISNARLKRLLGWRPRYPGFREGYENLLSR